MITHKQLLTLVLITTLAPHTTHTSTLKSAVEDFAQEYPYITLGTAGTLIGFAAFMGGRQSRRIELNQVRKTVDEAKPTVGQKGDGVITANDHFRDLQSIMATLTGKSREDFPQISTENVIQQAQKVVSDMVQLRTEYQNFTDASVITDANLERALAEKKEAKDELYEKSKEVYAKNKELYEKSNELDALKRKLKSLTAEVGTLNTKLDTLTATAEQSLQAQEKLQTRITELESNIQQLQIDIAAKIEVIRLTQKANTDLCQERDAAYKALLTDTAPENYATRENIQTWFKKRDFTEEQQTALSSLIACMQVTTETTDPITGTRKEKEIAFQNQPSVRLSTRTVPTDGDAIFGNRPNRTPNPPPTPKSGRRQWNKPTTPVTCPSTNNDTDASDAAASAAKDE